MATLTQIMLQQSVKNTMHAIDSFTHASTEVEKVKEVATKIQAAQRGR